MFGNSFQDFISPYSEDITLETELCGTQSVMADFYEVERIVDRKIDRNGKMLYFVKWKDWDESTNTWEPEAHLTLNEGVTKLLAEFNASWDDKNTSQSSDSGDSQSANRKRKGTSFPRKNSNTETKTKKVSSEVEIRQQCGFDKGYTAEKIVGAKQVDDAVQFLIKWMDSNDLELITNKQARTHCPQLVIKFYEENTRWDDEDY